MGDVRLTCTKAKLIIFSSLPTLSVQCLKLLQLDELSMSVSYFMVSQVCMSALL
jgi:hypothetical protein